MTWSWNDHLHTPRPSVVRIAVVLPASRVILRPVVCDCAQIDAYGDRLLILFMGEQRLVCSICGRRVETSTELTYRALLKPRLIDYALRLNARYVGHVCV